MHMTTVYHMCILLYDHTRKVLVQATHASQLQGMDSSLSNPCNLLLP